MEQKKAVTTNECSPTHVGAVPRSIVDYDQKKKSVINADDEHISLFVTILRAVGIDVPSRHPLVMTRNYNVVYWVKPGEELHTKMAQGVTPKWNHKSAIILQNLDDVDHTFLNVEVQRLNNETEPGTSRGRVVVGRARIPLPDEFDRRTRGSFPLLRADGIGHKYEGWIVVAMRLKRIRTSTEGLLPCQ